MLQIPKNVMQIGEINSRIKIYMEDYVHTFLERRKKNEVFLVFGKREERDGLCFYMIYGVEKKTDWDRGSLPYFKKYERIGTLDGPANRRTFKPVRGQAIPLDGYFVFYEQNEDMQTYMIAVRETEDVEGERTEEKEEVLEAVRTHKEQHRREMESGQGENAGERTASDKPVISIKKGAETWHKKRTTGIREALRRRADKNTVNTMRKNMKNRASGVGRTSIPRDKKRAWSFPDFCRAASFVLLLVLVVLGLTSVNHYPDMKAVGELFGNAAKAVSGKNKEAVAANASTDGILVEEASLQDEMAQSIPEAVMNETQETTGGMLSDAGAAVIQNDGDQIQWTIGQSPLKEEIAAEPEAEQEYVKKQETETAPAEKEPAGKGGDLDTAPKEPETASGAAAPQGLEETEEKEETATQAIARPVTYVVKRGDSLAGISRKFYGNTSKVKEICTVNEIKDPDQIRPGQNILLP